MNRPPSDHVCFKNWDKTSTSMESDIILEGFRKSQEMHGVKYARLVGDGDSSVLSRLREAMPYGPSLLVEKIECKNHILRNYCNRLKDIALNRKVGTVALRSAVRLRLMRLRYSVTKAIEFRRQQDIPLAHQSSELEKDIINGPSHVFGEHRYCEERGYFCDGRKEGEENLVPTLAECGLYQEVMSAVHRVAFHASSLIHSVTNNTVETYNSIVAKFVGGKRVNFACRGSYQARCEAAAASYNTKGELHRYVHKAMVNRSPGVFTKTFLHRRSRPTRKRKLVYPEEQTPKRFRSQNDIGADKDYGPESHKPDMSPSKFEEQRTKLLQSLRLDDHARNELQTRTVGQSRSQLWRQERLKRLTASSFGHVCKMRATTSCKNMVKKLLYSDQRTAAMLYGVEKEPFAVQQFESEFNVTVKSCGLFVDKDHCYLGASPDGLVGDDSVVEIKCPYAARNMTPAEAVAKKKVTFCTISGDGQMNLKANHNYMFQVQGQLHITQRKRCYFIFWTPEGMLVETIYRDDVFWTQKMEAYLSRFYFQCLLPELVDPR